MSLIIKRLAINQERTSSALLNHGDGVNFRIDRGKSEGEANLFHQHNHGLKGGPVNSV